MTRYKPSEEVGKAGWGALVADGKKWIDKAWGDHSIVECEEGTLKFYSQVDIQKVWAAWYFKGDILVKKVF